MNHSLGLGAALPGRPSREQHTFRGNLKSTRHGWLRLTPAYSVRLVDERLASLGRAAPPVLDPFCGTGTTLLACAEHGIDGDTVDINPFLIWLARTKLGRYTAEALTEAERGIQEMHEAALLESDHETWVPPLYQIEKWWSSATLGALGRASAALDRVASRSCRGASNLLRVAFCQVLIERSRAHFGHQSMSFAPKARASRGVTRESELADIAAVGDGLQKAMLRLLEPASIALPAAHRRVIRWDARRLDEKLPQGHYGSVITSPPYANRMSYIRELRPYMYWLRYLEDRKAAGVLDWHAIGGTWGSATSNLGRWAPKSASRACPPMLEARLAAIAERSPLLATYVRKYFHDMAAHLASLERVLRPGGTAFFVVGNSKFYDVLVPVQELLATQFEQLGFKHVEVETLRKRTSKKELYEYLISAKKG